MAVEMTTPLKPLQRCRDLVQILRINPSLAAQARKVLDVNKSERHIRGGLATREKYLREFNTSYYPKTS